jgi:feruloyl esterase
MLSQTLGLVVLALPLLAEAKDCSQAAFQKIIPSNSTFNYVTKVAEGGTFTDAYANANATNLPEGCAVSVKVPTPGNSSYNMAIYMPNKWNSRIITTGNGGYAGFTNWQDLGQYSHYGFSAITTVSSQALRCLYMLVNTRSGYWSLQSEPSGLNFCPQ